MDINPVLNKLKLTLIRPVYRNNASGRALYQVKHQATNLAYALKVFDRRLNLERQVTTEMTVLNRMAFGLVPHVHAFEKHGDGLYVLNDWIEGTPLANYCEGEPQDSYAVIERIRLVVGAGQRLQRIHREQLVHRDIKPDNLIVAGPRNRPDVFVIDFGNAAIKRELEEGTLAFRAPEQYALRGQRVSEKTDVFGLAQTLWYLLTGETAELELNAQMSDWDAPEYPWLPPDSPHANQLFQVLRDATAFSPKARLPMNAFLQQLRHICRG